MRDLPVGAVAGLSAARRLVASGIEVTVLEARDRVGGRTEGGVTADGTPVELEKISVDDADGVTHLRYRVVRG